MQLFSLSFYTFDLTFFWKKVSKKTAPKEIVAGPLPPPELKTFKNSEIICIKNCNLSHRADVL